jgi:proteasome lid subunit RPN8/RPN11/uncharacterized ubiquitin-like protein YukD
MADITVDLQAPSGITLEGTIVPEEMPEGEIIKEVLDALNLPLKSNEGYLEYYILHVNRNYYLAKGQSLRSAGVKNGDTLRLVSSADGSAHLSSSLDSANIIVPKPLESAKTLRIFLCHSSKDKKIVRDLYNRLRNDGFHPWLDEEELLPGQDWNQEIIKAVRSSDIVIVCLSEKSVNKAGYVQKEIKHALDVADEQPEGGIFLIPLKLEECEVPQRLSKWQWVNFFENEGYKRLLLALKVKATQASLHVRQDQGSSYEPKTKIYSPAHKTESYNLIESPFPINRLIHWIPKGGELESSVAADNLSSPAIVVTQGVLLEVSNHVAQTLQQELGGFLLGNLYRCPATTRTYILIDQFLPSVFEDAAEAGFGFGYQVWAGLSDSLDVKFRGKSLAGWYHSHPGMRVFLSSNDLEVHEARFPDPWMVALVIDPKNHLGGFFCRRNGSLNPRTPVDFYELLEYPTRDTVIAWTNFTGFDCVTNSQPALSAVNTKTIRGGYPEVRKDGHLLDIIKKAFGRQ